MPSAMTSVTPVSNDKNCNDIGYTFGSSAVVKGADVFALADDIESFSGNIHNRHDVVPLVLFANEELVPGGHGNPSALANETNEGHLAL